MRLSKIDNMKLVHLLVGAWLLLNVDPLPAQDSPSTTKTAVFAGGCFWCIQPAFDKAPGVIRTTVGYCGGAETNPTHEFVGSEKTTHPEMIPIAFDPAKNFLNHFLAIYLKQIDPNQAQGQFTPIRTR